MVKPNYVLVGKHTKCLLLSLLFSVISFFLQVFFLNFLHCHFPKKAVPKLPVPRFWSWNISSGSTSIWRFFSFRSDFITQLTRL